MEEEIDIEHLINLISQRPLLWDKSTKEYHNRPLVMEGWREVCSQLNADFANLDDEGRNVYEKLILKKWRNIRDQWTKRCRLLEDKTKSGTSAKKVKKYVYQDQLAFLKKTYDSKDTAESTFSPYSPEAQSDETTTTTQGDSTADNNEAPPPTKKPKLITPTTEKRVKSSQDKKTIEENILEALKEGDDPKLEFFKSLLPNISDFPNDDFLLLQCRFLQIIQDIKGERMIHNHASTTPPPTASAQYGWQGSAQPGFSGRSNQALHVPNQRRGHVDQPAQDAETELPLDRPIKTEVVVLDNDAVSFSEDDSENMTVEENKPIFGDCGVTAVSLAQPEALLMNSAVQGGQNPQETEETRGRGLREAEETREMSTVELKRLVLLEQLKYFRKKQELIDIQIRRELRQERSEAGPSSSVLGMN